MNQQGQFDVARKTIYWGIISVVITIIVMAFAFIVVGYKERLIAYPAELRAELLSLRFTNIPECFAYQDPMTKLVQLNTIDLTRFTPEIINNCYNTEQEFGYRDMNFRLQLLSAGKSVQTNNYYNVDHFTLHRDVLVYDNGKFNKDELLIYVQDGIAVRPEVSRVDTEQEQRAAAEKAAQPGRTR